MPVESVFDAKAFLGEGPAWDARTQTLYWLDILNKRVYAGSDLLAELDDLIGCIAPRKCGGLVLALTGEEGRFSFASLEPASGKLTGLASLENEPSKHRFNDGKCDPRGRFLAGTMDMSEKNPAGSLYSFDGTSITKLLSGVTISNGMTWSPGHTTFYYIDTPTREVKAFDYEIETGAISSPRVAVRVHESLGWPTA